MKPYRPPLKKTDIARIETKPFRDFFPLPWCDHCKMSFLDGDTVIRATKQGVTDSKLWHFCSQECMEAYRAQST